MDVVGSAGYWKVLLEKDKKNVERAKEAEKEAALRRARPLYMGTNQKMQHGIAMEYVVEAQDKEVLDMEAEHLQQVRHMLKNMPLSHRQQ